MPDMPSYQDKMWIKLWKENSTELRERVVSWRKQNAVTRIEKPYIPNNATSVPCVSI